MSGGSELDRAARDVIDAGRDVPVPNEFVARRVRSAVELALRGGARAPAARSSVRATTKVWIALGPGALGGALYATELVRSGEPEASAPPAEPKVAAPRAALPPLPPPPASEPTIDGAAAARAEAEAPLPESRASAPAARAAATPVRAEEPAPSRSQQLSAEIELLARVNAAVNAGDGRQALASLREYDRRFGGGILAEERAAASVLALCAARQPGAARAQAERFARRWPRSPLLGRVERSCAGSK